MNTSMAQDENLKINKALDRGIENYIRTRREKIPGFVRTHFSFSGAARINRKALGGDIIKFPLNLVWALPYTSVQATSLLLKRSGFNRIHRFAKKIPAGLTTAVQKEINRLIFIELLELPHDPGNKEEQTDALLAEILNQPEIASLLYPRLVLICTKSKEEGFRTALEIRLREYAVGRTAVSEIAANIVTLSTGMGMLGKITPGGISLGSAIAGALAQQSAISNFFLGPALGGVYYGMFPATASVGMVVASTSAVLASMAVITAFSGFITDPILAGMGIHQKRLNRLVDTLADALQGKGDSALQLRTQYLARIFDILDLLKTAADTVV